MIRGRRVAFGVTDSAFIMGSMGSVVGEKLTRTIERATDAAVAADHHFRLRRRRPDARRHALADADGQGLGGPGPLRHGRRAVHLRADQSDDGRRGGQLRLAGRRGLRRAPGPDRLRRPADHQGHHPHRAAQGLPDQRVPAWSTASSTASSAARTCKANWPEPSTTAGSSEWTSGSWTVSGSENRTASVLSPDSTDRSRLPLPTTTMPLFDHLKSMLPAAG